MKVNCRKNLIPARQAAARLGVADKAINVSVFDHVVVKNFFAETDGVRYPNDAVINISATKDYLNQNGDLIFFKEEC